MFQIPQSTTWGKKKEPFRVRKLPIPGFFFLADKQVGEMCHAADGAFATIGHHRAATHGTVSADNAHPFVHGSLKEKNMLVGVHNGTINSFNSYQSEFEVDSDWLYDKIHREGAAKALSGLNGAYALVWYEQATNRIRIASNGQRTIFFAPLSGSNILLIGSEHEQIHWLARRNGLKIEQPLYPEVGKIYSWTLERGKEVRTVTDVEDILPVEKKETSPVVGAAIPFRSPVELRPGPTPGATSQTSTTSSNHGVGVGTTTKGGNEIVSFYQKDKCNESLKDFGFEFDQEVSFEPTGSDNDPGMLSSNDVHGWIEPADGNTVMGEAIMVGTSPQVRWNMKRFGQSICKVIGHRKVIDKEGNVTDYALVGLPILLEAFNPPAVIAAKDEQKQELAVIEPVDEATIQGPRRRMITETTFNLLTKDGCIQCSCNLTKDMNEAAQMLWTEDGPCCIDCHQSFLAQRAH